MKVLLLHGLESTPGGSKSEALAAHGCTLINPALPKDSWERSLAIAQAAVDGDRPEVIVGSSRGGALALNVDARGARLVLIAPAWRRFGTVASAPATTIVLHSDLDDVVPIADSIELVRASALPPERLVVVGLDHRMKDPAALAALWTAVRAPA